MTNEHPGSANTSQNESEYRRNYWENRDYFEWAKTPGFNPMKLAAVVAGFAIFPPLGAAALLYFLWKGRRGYGRNWGGPAYAGGFGGGGHHRCGGRGRHGRWSGNQAFDQHQAEQIDKLRAEREAFWAYRAEQRRKRDQEAFDGFRAARDAAPKTPEAE